MSGSGKRVNAAPTLATIDLLVKGRIMVLLSLPLVPVPVEYRECVGFPGYRVGTDGSVWSHFSEKFLKPQKAGKGYVSVSLSCDTAIIRFYVHQLVAAAFIGPCPVGMEVCHEDNNRSNNRVSNLRYDTRRGNLADRDRHGTHQRGERNPAAKLTDQQSQEVREMRAAGLPLKVIAFRFGIQESTVSRIANGQRRKEAKDGA